MEHCNYIPNLRSRNVTTHGCRVDGSYRLYISIRRAGISMWHNSLGITSQQCYARCVFLLQQYCGRVFQDMSYLGYWFSLRTRSCILVLDAFANINYDEHHGHEKVESSEKQIHVVIAAQTVSIETCVKEKEKQT